MITLDLSAVRLVTVALLERRLFLSKRNEGRQEIREIDSLLVKLDLARLRSADTEELEKLAAEIQLNDPRVISEKE